MKALSAAIIEVILEDFGTEEVLRRLSDPYWFQALGCVVGFDWHSSGVTTTLCGALKEGLAEIGPQAGLFLAGGKGRVARRTPMEIADLADRYPLSGPAEDLIYASRMAAKVDSSAVQDGYQIYHHFFVFTQEGSWAVIQQGMREDLRQARRYHWLGSSVNDFVVEPQAAICCNNTHETLNLVSSQNDEVRSISAQLACLSPDRLLSELATIQSCSHLSLPRQHSIPRTNYLNRSLQAAYEQQPQDFETLLGVSGVGPATLRALCLVAEIAYGVQPSYSDPVRYSFAHGGKDGFPFPVQEDDIRNSYVTLRRALRKARLGNREQLDALQKLAGWHAQVVTTLATPVFQQNPLPNPIPAPLIQQPTLF
ncbi:MAG: DUF763 domain-containing protein [Syntrophomonadaceae bacterium]|jgi:hypothetical protein